MGQNRDWEMRQKVTRSEQEEEQEEEEGVVKSLALPEEPRKEGVFNSLLECNIIKILLTM